ncbi:MULTISPECIES: LCP family protein [Prauserella salsuginis group]|uniref:LCP family protein n=1 Tax=Prauserella salsuginis TaxID=387889 RepID=A0ABW6FZW8_9PSEU|nr:MULTISPECIES: LCP family protein [Prauserella salsuginis group]MCR3721092.1 transcriptional attenuator, LytR family [Prauserella flava]MCR3734827.1 transcriptional attenuator, LytR family [Prauserella salsuginis]
MTDQMEPVDEQTQYKRKIDNTLARFSAAHDELEAEESERRARKERLAARIEHTRTKLQAVVTSKIGGRGSAVSRDRESGGEAGAGADRAELDGADPEQSDPEQSDPEQSDTGHAEAGHGDEDTPSRTRLQEKKKRKNDRARLASKTLAIVAAALVFLATGAAWGAKTWFDSKFNQIAALDENSAHIMPGQIGDENFIVLGSDTREGAEAEEDVGTAADVGGARSDTLMVAHVPEDRSRAVVVSFPRDLEISRPACERWDSDSGRYGEVMPAADQVKINTAFSVGGPKCVTKVVQELTGMKINHFVGIDFHGFKGMVDAVGGVNVQIDKPIVDETLGKVVTETGNVKLKGDQALNYVRARKVYSDPTFSDYGRMERQQKFLSSLLDTTLSSDVLFNTGKLSRFIDAFTRSTFGEGIGVDQMLTLAQSMRGFDAGKVEFLTVPTVGEANERGNEVLLEGDSQALFDAIIDNTPLPGDEASADGPPSGDGSSGGQPEPDEQQAAEQPASASAP